MSVDIEARARKSSPKIRVVAASGLEPCAESWRGGERRSRHAFVSRQTGCFASSAREASVANAQTNDDSSRDWRVAAINLQHAVRMRTVAGLCLPVSLGLQSCARPVCVFKMPSRYTSGAFLDSRLS